MFVESRNAKFAIASKDTLHQLYIGQCANEAGIVILYGYVNLVLL